MPRANRYLYMAHVCFMFVLCLFYVCCSDCVGSVGMFVVLWALLKIVFLAFEYWSMLHACVRDVMYVVF